MEMIIAILLGIIVILLNRSINEQLETRNLLEKKLFDKESHNGGLLNELGYLKHIHKELEKLADKNIKN